MPAPEYPALFQLMEGFPRLFRDEAPPGSHLPTGWIPLVTELCRGIDRLLPADEAAAQFKVKQIKEKLGGLRFYWSLRRVSVKYVDVLGLGSYRNHPGGTDMTFNQIDALVSYAQVRSFKICDVCGQDGQLRVLTDDPAWPSGYFTLAPEQELLPDGILATRCETHADRRYRQSNR